MSTTLVLPYLRQTHTLHTLHTSYLLHQHVNHRRLAVVKVPHKRNVAHQLWVGHQRGQELIAEPVARYKEDVYPINHSPQSGIEQQQRSPHS